MGPSATDRPATLADGGETLPRLGFTLGDMYSAKYLEQSRGGATIRESAVVTSRGATRHSQRRGLSYRRVSSRPLITWPLEQTLEQQLYTRLQRKSHIRPITRVLMNTIRNVYGISWGKIHKQYARFGLLLSSKTTRTAHQ